MSGEPSDGPRTPVGANGFDPFAAQRADPTQPMTDPSAALFASLAERYPDTFGGMYFEGVASVVVQVLDNPDAGALVSEATIYVQAYYPVSTAPSVRAETVRNSHAALTDVLRRVDADRANIATQGGSLHSVHLDLRRNRVLALFMNTPVDVQTRIVSAYAPPDVLVTGTITEVIARTQRQDLHRG
jgi:hypothetical protein